MAIKAFTKCVQPADFNTFPRFVRLILGAAAIGIPADLMAIISKHYWCLLIAAEINLCIYVIVYCDYMLYQRLICLGGDQAVIGMIVTIGNPSGRGIFDPDNDYTLDLLPRHIEPGTLQEEAQEIQPFGQLLTVPQAVIDRGLPDKGKVAKDKFTGISSAVLHAEFEGKGYVNLQRSAEVALALAYAALVACILPFFSGLLALILALAAAAFLGVVGLIGKGGPGNPSDVNANLGELHVNGVDDQGNPVRADIVYIRGTWVYDPLHDGWNEIHPVKECSKVCQPWTGDWATTCGDDLLLRLTQAFDTAAAPETIAAQARPENQWTMHPDIDACATVIIE